MNVLVDHFPHYPNIHSVLLPKKSKNEEGVSSLPAFNQPPVFLNTTEACFLTADHQCTELPLLRLPRLVPEVVGCCDPASPET